MCPDTHPAGRHLEDLLEIISDATIVVDGEGRIVFANERMAKLFGWPAEELVGRPFAALASLRDVNRRRRMEEELRASEERFRLAAGHTVDVIQEVNVEEDWQKLYGDVDALMGYEPGGFPRSLTAWFEQMHPEDREQVAAEMEEAIATGAEEWHFRYRIRAGDGSYHHWDDHGTVTGYLEDGRANAGTGAIRDVTEEVERQRQLEATLAELEALKERLVAENVYLREEIGETLHYEDMVGESAPWRRVLRQLELVAASDTPVLLSGETGTGKELVARALHAKSGRRDRPLIKVNCAALPSTLIESELFGHEKGAFSGAEAMRRGRFELADQGTLFLDEIGEMPLELQTKLLHVLEGGQFERLGSSKTRRADVRVIAATNRELPRAIDGGRIRADLYYRLAVFPIELPPLRDRPGDVPLLATYFLTRHNAKHGRSIDAISRASMEALCAYEWPGNVRELENLIERAVIVSPGTTLRLDGLLGLPPAVPGHRSLMVRSAAAPSAETGAVAVANPGATLEEMERAHILAVLEACGFKVKGKGNAAERLGLKESTLRSRMKKLGIRRPGS